MTRIRGRPADGILDQNPGRFAVAVLQQMSGHAVPVQRKIAPGSHKLTVL
jgi:hypothetical protein